MNSSIFCTSVKANKNTPEKVFYLNNEQSIKGTLFTEDELIGPGDKLLKEFYIINNNSFKCFLKSIDLNGKLYDKNRNILNKDSNEFKNYMKNSRISFYCEGELIFSGNIDEILNISLTGDDSIEMIENGKKKFQVEYSLDKNADNNTMNMEHKFDISFNFSADDSQVIDKGVSGGLVQTGSFIDIKLLLVLGSLLCIIGVMFLANKEYK
jgi:hypothetical protein